MTNPELEKAIEFYLKLATETGTPEAIDNIKKIRDNLYRNPVSDHPGRRALDRDVEEIGKKYRNGDFSYRAYILKTDINLFKLINDVHGHGIGDQAIKTSIKTMHDSVEEHLRRDHDSVFDRESSVYHLGGDEGLVLILVKDDHAAYEIADWMMTQVNEESRSKLGFPVEISVGIAKWEKEGNYKDAEERADRNLRIAKALGEKKPVGLQYQPEVPDEDLKQRMACEVVIKAALHAGYKLEKALAGDSYVMTKIEMGLWQKLKNLIRIYKI